MTQCARRFDSTAPCAFDREQPIALGGCFEFIPRDVKILFLDIDGVLNSAFVLNEQRRGDAIDRGMIERVNQIVDATGCMIVISSSWRLYHKMDKLTTLLYGYGLRQVVIDRTPELDIEDFNRGNEINAWLAAHPGITSFVILDDNPDSDMRNLVQTTFKHGLQDEHVAKAIQLLTCSTA